VPKKLFKATFKSNDEKEFYEYANLFNDDYDSEFESSRRNTYNATLEAAGFKPLTDSKLFKSKVVEF
jgi:hypothetical protein